MNFSLSANGVSDADFFAQEVERGFTTILWPDILRMHERAAMVIKEQLDCRSAFEIGSGLGAFLLACQSMEWDVRGMDRNRFERDFALSRGVAPQRYLLDDLRTFRIPQAVDAIVCIEVFEHCTDAEIDSICRQLAFKCRWFYFTSTPHADLHDAEWGHINLKTREEWVKFFSKYSLVFDREERSLVDWGLLFRGTGSEILDKID